MVTKLLTLNGEDQLCLPDAAVLTVAHVMHSLPCTAHAHAQISMLKPRKQQYDFHCKSLAAKKGRSSCVTGRQ